MKLYSGCRFVKASTRPPRAVTDQAIFDRVEYSKLFLALHTAGVYLTYTDESSYQTNIQKGYAWRTSYGQKFIIAHPKVRAITSIVTHTDVKVIQHWADGDTNDSKVI